MYESHFGFSGSPFQLNPDPAFYFGSRGHSNALAYLKFGAHQGEGFIVVTGEIGAGKTTLVRTLLEGLNPEQVVAAQVVSTQLESGELLQAILMSFGIASSSNSKAHLIGSLEAFLTSLAAKGRRALLIIDEAQNLKHEAVEELRMLSNFQLGKYGLLQSFLVGQPELRQLLQSKSMEQLRQRVIASCHLGPLAPQETRAYVEHRLRLVGWAANPQFAEESFERIHLWTGGVPRKINRLCNRLLLGAFLDNEEEISAALVDKTAGELRSEIGELSEVPESHRESAAADRTQRSIPKDVDAEPASEAIPRPRPVALEPDVDKLAPIHETQPSASEALGAVLRGAHYGSDSVRSTASLAGAKSLGSDAAAGGQFSRADVSARRTEVRAPLAVIAASNPTIVPTEKSSPLHDDALSGVHRPESGSVHRQTYRAGPLHRPLICLVDSASDFLKAGTLAEAFLKFPNLPPLVAVHPGAESDVSFGHLGAVELPMPSVALHMQCVAPGFALQVPQVLRIFEEILNEFDPQGVFVMGSSDAVLACSLLCAKRGTTLYRIGGGQRGPERAGRIKEVNGPLIDRLSDALYVNRMDSYYTLYQEGIKSDRVLCVGNLVGDMLKRVLSHAPRPAATLKHAKLIQEFSETLPRFALVTISAVGNFQSKPALHALANALCALGPELPSIWPLSEGAQQHLQGTEMAAKLIAARVTLLSVPGYLQYLGLLEGAACLVADADGTLVEEARSLHIPSLHLDYSVVKSALFIQGESSTDAQTPEQMGTTIRQYLASLTTTPDSPAYWDSGTAIRIANHLLTCLPANEKVSYAKA